MKPKSDTVKKILSSVKALPDGRYQCRFCSKVFRCQHTCPELNELLEKVK